MPDPQNSAPQIAVVDPDDIARGREVLDRLRGVGGAPQEFLREYGLHKRGYDECKALEDKFLSTPRGQGPWGAMYKLLHAQGLKVFMTWGSFKQKKLANKPGSKPIQFDPEDPVSSLERCIVLLQATARRFLCVRRYWTQVCVSMSEKNANRILTQLFSTLDKSGSNQIESEELKGLGDFLPDQQTTWMHSKMLKMCDKDHQDDVRCQDFLKFICYLLGQLFTKLDFSGLGFLDVNEVLPVISNFQPDGFDEAKREAAAVAVLEQELEQIKRMDDGPAKEEMLDRFFSRHCTEAQLRDRAKLVTAREKGVLQKREQILAKLDSHHDQMLNLNEFVNVVVEYGFPNLTEKEVIRGLTAVNDLAILKDPSRPGHAAKEMGTREKVLLRVFRVLDSDSSDSITVDEVAALAKVLSEKHWQVNVPRIMKAADSHNNAVIDFDEFKAFVIKILESLFKQMDTDHSGYLDNAEMVKMSKAKIPHWTEERHLELMRKMDVDGDQKVGKREFIDYICAHAFHGLYGKQLLWGLKTIINMRDLEKSGRSHMIGADDIILKILACGGLAFIRDAKLHQRTYAEAKSIEDLYLASLTPEARAHYLGEDPQAVPPAAAPAPAQEDASDLLELLRQLEQQERFVETRYDELIDIQKERINTYEEFRSTYDGFRRQCFIHGRDLPAELHSNSEVIVQHSGR